MPQFRITSPDGTVYNVTGPEGATEQDALAQVQAQAGAPQGQGGPSIPRLGTVESATALAQLAPQSSPSGISDQIEAGRRFSRQAPFAIEGAIGSIPGIPGDVASLGGWLSRALPQQSLAAHALSLLGRSGLPTSTETQNRMFGEPKSEDQRMGRMFGSMFTPLGGKAGALEDAARIAAQKGASVSAARQMARSPEGRANEILARSLARDRLSPENAQQALQQFGDKPLTVADIAGNATARKARMVNTLEGEGSDQMATFLADRQAGQHGRVQDDIAGNLAGGGDIYSMGKRLMADREARAAPLYREAYAANENITSPDLEAILATDAGKAALDSARRMMRNSRLPMGEAEVARPKLGAAGGTVQMGATKKGETLFEAIRKLGGFRTHDAQGFVTREGGEVRHALKDVRSSGLINNRGGLAPDNMREALRERGWFGERSDKGADIDEMYQALRGGRDMQHPNATVVASASEGNARNLGEMRDLADEFGVGYQRNWGAADIASAADDAERSAMRTGGEAAGRNLQTLDYVKRAFDDQIGAAQRSGLKNEARILTGLKKGLVSELDRMDTSGKYARARAAFSGPSQTADALESGGDFLKMSPGEIADTFKGMDQSDVEFFRVGAAQRLRDMVDSAKDNADAARRIFGDKATRDRVSAVFGRAAADSMAQSMSAERMMTGTNQMVRGNSTTMNKAAEMAEGEGAGASLARDAAKGFVAGGFRGAVALPLMNRAQTGIESFFNRMPPEVRAALAQRLTAVGPDAQRVLSDILSQTNAVQNARIVPGGSANVPRIDPRVIAALLATSGASIMAQQ